MAGHLERTHSSSADELRRKTERERTDGGGRGRVGGEDHRLVPSSGNCPRRNRDVKVSRVPLISPF